jgi:hypothetical protein
MNYKLSFIAVIFGLLLLASCKNDSKDKSQKTEAKEASSLTFETKSFERKGGECKEDHMKCIVIKLKYPLAKEGNEKVRNSINQFTTSMLLEAIVPDPDKNIKDLEGAAEQMIQYYQEQLVEFPDYEPGWEVEVDGSAEIVDDYAVITLPMYSNLGGAHPNHHISIANFNLQTGEELQLLDIIQDPKAFKELAQKRFVDSRLSDYNQGEVTIYNFFFGEGFQLPENFAIKKEGIFFYYNPYEAAPYALGTTEFTISYKDLETIIKM